MEKCPSIPHVWCGRERGNGSASIPKPRGIRPSPQSDCGSLSGTFGRVCRQRSHRDATERTVLVHVLASRFGTAHNRAHKDEEWLSSNRASQCRRTEGDWIAEATSTEGIRSGFSTRGIAGPIRHPVPVPTLPRGGENFELRLAFKPPHILFLVGDGRRIDQRDPGTRRSQDNYDVCALQPSLARASAFCHRPDCHGKLN